MRTIWYIFQTKDGYEDSETTTALFNNMMGKPSEILDSVLGLMKKKGGVR